MVTRRHSRRRNPGGVNVMDYLKLGASVVGGAVGSKMLTQAVMSTSNTGVTGYFGNLVATIALGWGAKMAFRDEKIAQGVIGGGLAQVIVRALSDNTPYGAALSGAGLGDYQTGWNFWNPMRVSPGYPPRSYALPAGSQTASMPVASMPVVTHAAPANAASAKAGMGQRRWN